MKKQTFFLTLIVTQFVFLMTGNAAPLKPFLDPVRTELSTQLALIPTETDADRKLIGKIKTALRAIDKPGTASVAADVKALNLVTNALKKTALAETFAPLLDTALDKYAQFLVAESALLDVRLDKLDTSKLNTSARNNLDQLLELLNGLATSEDLAAALKALGKAATKFAVTTTLTSKAENPPVGANKMTANINGTVFNANPLVLNAAYNPVGRLIVLGGSQVVGATATTLTLTIGNLTEGTSTHTFAGSGNEAIGAYAKAGLTGLLVGTVSKSGTITITHDSAKKVVSGTFSFVANDQAEAHLTTVTNGKFVLRYQ